MADNARGVLSLCIFVFVLFSDMNCSSERGPRMRVRNFTFFIVGDVWVKNVGMERRSKEGKLRSAWLFRSNH